MTPDLTRRRLLAAGAGLLLGPTLLAACGGESDDDVAEAPDRRPNILVILTDQERAHVHWPEGMLERLMPSWARLRANGIEFTRAYCAASQCSPSRACLLTGEYAPTNGVSTLPDEGMPTLADLPNIASVLADAGYDVVWKGKWHLSFPLSLPPNTPPSKEVWQPEDIEALDERYGMGEWNPPDAGNNAGAFGTAGVPSMGGGAPDNDGRIVRGVSHDGQTPGVEGGGSALDFLAAVAATEAGARRPFALFVSLINPHDITFFPTGWDVGGYRLEDFDGLGVELPPNADDPLDTKPSVQRAYRDALAAKDPLADDPAAGPTRSQYVNFYAHVHGLVDQHIQAILDAVEQHGLAEDTLIVRTADHGEGGLSHGLREKSYSAYEEMIHVPLVIANPRLFPEPGRTDALWSHVDLLPTLAELAGAEPVGVGRSLAPVLLGRSPSVQQDVLFAYDDDFVLPADQAGGRIRALRDSRWTYAVYFDSTLAAFEYELYDNDSDPLQLVNLAHEPTPEVLPVWRELHGRLVTRIQETRALEDGVAFPADPTAA